jgi:hypothetical protein
MIEKEDWVRDAVKNYKYTNRPASWIQRLKSLHCFTYQCAEGNVPKSKLYKLCIEKEHELANAIINEMPEYDKAKWG